MKNIEKKTNAENHKKKRDEKAVSNHSESK